MHCSQHRSADLLALLDFMRPQAWPKVAMPAPSFAPPAPKFAAPAPALPAVAVPPVAPVRRLACARCAVKISFPESRFFWNNASVLAG